MKLADPHLDVADMYKYFRIPVDDFFSDRMDIPVSLKKIDNINLSLIGLSLYYDKSFLKTSFYDGVHEFIRFYQEILSRTDRFNLIQEAGDLESDDNVINFFYSIEGFECLQNINDFNEFYELGVRSWGPSYDEDNLFSSARQSKVDRGLTRLGHELFHYMNYFKLLVDISHLSSNSIRDIDEIYDGPMMCSHSNVDSVWSNTHNLQDWEIQIIVDHKGVVSLLPLKECVGEKGILDELFHHMDYIINKWGIEYVATCSDIYPLKQYPFINDRKDILILQDIKEYLIKRMSEQEVNQIMYGNWMRLLGQSL